MFDAVIFASQGDAAETLRRLVTDSPLIALDRGCDQLPSPYEAARIMNGVSPDIVFLELSDLDQAVSVAAEVRRFSSNTAVIGFGIFASQELRDSLAKSGIHDVLGSAASEGDVADCVDRAIHAIDATRYSNLVVFLPGKAGSGSTVTALNVAGALKRDLEQRVLLLEADTRSGILATLTDSHPRLHLQDILERAGQLTGAEWESLIVTKSGVDLVFARHNRRGSLPQWYGYYQLLKLVCSRYDMVIVDLPEAVNEATAEIVQRAETIHIVCTPELPSAELGRQRRDELLARGVERDRISVIMNRWTGRGMASEEFEKNLDLPIAFQIPNDYLTINQATLAGGFADPSSELGQSFARLARQLAGVAEPEPTGALAGFLSRWRQRSVPAH
ncbi:MAG: AAA family ATPase [bacterium]|nr:AAA family ATPase [bacterium]